jgi:hypothetical protein
MCSAKQIQAPPTRLSRLSRGAEFSHFAKESHPVKAAPCGGTIRSAWDLIGFTEGCHNVESNCIRQHILGRDEPYFFGELRDRGASSPSLVKSTAATRTRA